MAFPVFFDTLPVTNLCADTETPFYNAAIDRDVKAVTTFLAAGVKPSFFPSGAEFEFV